MKIRTEKIPFHHVKHHETKQHVLIKFLAVLLIIIVYFVLMSQKYGIENGFLVTLLTWSFFVLSTPIADAGFVIDFPLRLIARIKMVYSELIVWFIAIGLNIYSIFLRPEIYNTTQVLSIFKKILTEPFPFWGIIFLSALGTFISVHFGDELMDTVKHHERNFYHKHKYNYRYIVMVFVFAISLTLYSFLIKKLGIENIF